MAVTKFILEIEIGNEAMKSPANIAKALEAAAKQVPHVIPLKGGSTKIRDDNGNTVGAWSYK
jgi:hypothetical protein